MIDIEKEAERLSLYGMLDAQSAADLARCYADEQVALASLWQDNHAKKNDGTYRVHGEAGQPYGEYLGRKDK